MYVLHLEKWGLISFTWYNCSDTKRLRLKKMIVGNGPPCMVGVLSVVAWARIFWKKIPHSLKLTFPMRRDSATFRDKGITGLAQNLATGRDRMWDRTITIFLSRSGMQGWTGQHYFLSLCFSWNIFSCFRTSFSALSRFVPRPVPDFGCPGPSHHSFGYHGPSCPLARFLACPVIPLSRKVALSRLVRNTCFGIKIIFWHDA